MAWNIARLKAVRAAFGETQTEFARRLGVSQPTVKKWECGAPIPEVVCKLLDRIEKEAPSSLQSA